jgi:hypothetical protein
MNRINRELIVAARENNVPEVQRLLRAGADVNVKDNCGRTPLHWACNWGHLQIVNELVDHGADIEANDRNGSTPLQWASLRGHVQVVQALVEHGADIEAINIEGWTPLHFACYNGHVSVVIELLSRGANILAADDQGRLPIHLAVSLQNSEVAKYLLQHYYATIIRRLPLHELLKDLTWNGISNSSDDPPLRSAFHLNVLGTDDVVEIIEYLVDRDPTWLTSRDEEASLPIHVACRLGVSFTIVQSLVNHYKASVKSVTPGGDMPLFLACDIPEPSLDIIFLLMKMYPDLVYR